ncbi:cell wall protein DAN4-like [Stylophora pistillata]|uniref:cell wall protein DAN4-like n=1 Tax=Stylophora pistillata TaxID=50429 RepID=UPI000C052B37|nr:cell wall protein DAN4-like [Stylophora pistillata]
MLRADNIHFTITSTSACTSTSGYTSTLASTSTPAPTSISSSTSTSALTFTSASMSTCTSASTSTSSSTPSIITGSAPATCSVDIDYSSAAGIQHVLTKMCGIEAAKHTLGGGRIEEEEVLVVDLCLSAPERLTLYASCTHLFTTDAWLSVGVSMKHSDEATSLVLPIYTTADEQFWLFHTISKPTRIVKFFPRNFNEETTRCIIQCSFCLNCK